MLFNYITPLVLGLQCLGAVAGPLPLEEAPRLRRSTLLASSSDTDVENARLLVQEAIANMTVLNKARIANPMRNQYVKGSSSKRATTSSPLLDITSELANAAALVAEADAATSPIATTSRVKRSGDFWLGNIDHRGTVPWGSDSSYTVYRNVVDYGADPTGATDSTAAITSAMTDGSRCGLGCNGSTQKNAIVYFPPGTYLISSSIPVLIGTQVIGDAIDPPTLKASSSFVGLGVLSTDVYIGGYWSNGDSAEYYVNTNRFYSQIRNLKIDITATDASASICGLHYQIAQATSTQNLEIIATSGTTQQGIYAENGSGGFLSDITFTGGAFGLYGGNQQWSAQRLTFNGCDTAVQITWDWGWVWKNITVNNAAVGFRLNSDSSIVGSTSFIDTQMTGITTASIIMNDISTATDSGTTGLVLDNVNLDGPVLDASGNTLLAAGKYDSWVVGPTYSNNARTFQTGSTSLGYTRQSSLLGASVSGLNSAPYFERPKEQYVDKSASDFVHMKDFATGDGSTDDTAGVQSCFDTYSDGSKIIYVDAGTYLLTDTVTIPKDAKIVGETWSQFAASGSNFADATNPRVMLKVGNSGDVGTVEIQDLILTTKGGTAGAILMEWNVKAESAGAAAIWDVHARVGGAVGTELTPDECPAITTGTNPASCQAASLLFHQTAGSSGYFENMWMWVADHMLDDDDLEDEYNDSIQVSIYSARGWLIESTDASWLYGTAAEHNVFYQYNFNGAQNIFTTMIQTESPYFQNVPAPPAPFASAVGKINGDPDYTCGGGFDGCDEAWGAIIKESANIHISSADVYSWFSVYSQDCLADQSCQQALISVEDNYDGVRIQHLITVGSKYQVVSGGSAGTGIAAADNLESDETPYWSDIAIYDVPSSGAAP